MSFLASAFPGCTATRLMSFALAGIIAFLAGCAADGGAIRGAALSESGAGRNADELLVVDCLLPGQIRKLGTAMTYLSARRAIKTSAQDCEIRGGEYTAYDRASYATALKVWLPLAQEGDKSAQTYVGEIYEKGLGIAPDYQAAAMWYRKAADQGYSRAQINLGYLCEKGLGVTRDPATALNWYRRASGLSEAIVLESDAAARSRELTQLREEVQTRKRSEVSLRRELDTTRRQLERAQKELQRRRGEAAAVQQRLETARAELEKRKQQAEARGDMAVVQRTDQQIRAREEELARSREQMARIEAEANRYREQLAKLESQQGTQQGEVLALRKEVEQRRTESASMRQQLEQARTQLAQAQQDLQRQQAEAAAQAEKLAKLKPEIESQRQQAQAAGDQQAMKRIEAQVKQRERELERSRERVARMEAAADRYREQLAKLESQQGAQQGEVLALRKEVEQRRSESASMRRQLEQVRSQLAQAQQDLQRQQAQAEKLAKSKPEIEQQRQQAQAAGDTELVKKIEAELRSREEELAHSREQIGRLNGEVSRYREQLAQMEKSPAKGTEPAQMAQGGPVIEIIDPVIRATRGVPEVKTRSGIQRLVVGRVTAPAGLLAFTVNERPQEVDSSGLFRTQFSIAGSSTSVQLVAIDKQGRRSEAEFMFVPERAAGGNGGKAASAALAGPGFIPPVDFGKYYALVIGNNDYTKVPKLDTPANDARAISDLLRKRYGFQVTTLLNATRYQVLSELNKFREKLTDKDNLLIYYAGHGELDKVNQRGYWLPVDAEPDSNANWISTFDITDLLNAMAAKQILVIADSCYSGALTRSSLGRLEAGMSAEAKLNWYKVMSTKRSRTVLTAGGLAPVLDAGGGDHSVFAKALLDVLATNNGVMEGERLYREVSARVSYAAAAVEVEQLPEYAPIRYAGHETGDFFFVPAGGSRGT